MAGFDKLKGIFRHKREMPDGLWMKCPDCKKMIFKRAMEDRNKVCPECSYHFTLTPRERIELMLDHNSFEELWPELVPQDPLGFVSDIPYREKLAKEQQHTGHTDAIVIGYGHLEAHRIIFGVTDSRFMMGSMGSVVGEKITRGFELAREQRLPVVIVSGSGGGARMQEGCLSLMQMAKVSAAIGNFSGSGGLYISILTNPTMAGVMASFASLGDIIIAEPKALIGFTGPRVIKQTIRSELPDGFQTSEFLLEHGFIDRIVPREGLRQEVARLLYLLS
jgi:acetyl-CoA carboxylase carboxyl transferase subunit beta